LIQTDSTGGIWGCAIGYFTHFTDHGGTSAMSTTTTTPGRSARDRFNRRSAPGYLAASDAVTDLLAIQHHRPSLLGLLADDGGPRRRIP
jgi:hypothetical protein